MTINISDYDLFSLLESALDEDSMKNYEDEKRGAEDFVRKAKEDNYHLSLSGKSKRKKNKINQNEPKDEDFDIIDDDEKESEENDESEDVEKPEPTSVNLSDAVIYEKFVDDLNMFRAAHSFSDKEISTELQNYFNSLSREEKQVMHILIKGLIHVTMMDVKGKSAKTPSDFSLKVIKTGATSREKKKSLDNRISAEKKGKSVDKNTPISVEKIKIGESIQDKSEILKVLNSYK